MTASPDAFRSLFQSTLPHGERRSGVHTTLTASISIHAPAWGATYECGVLDGSTEFQSTLPHGERRVTDGVAYRVRTISIHAPAWGATIRLSP